jgi:predicted ribosome quality control (RQC) complex YloA/Tae2 family protein
MFCYKSFVGFLLVACLGGISVFGQPSNAKPVENDSPTVKALLDEVRQLRQVLQRNSVATYRAQVTLERLKLQQAQVNELTRELAELRNRIKELERNAPMLAENLPEVERRVTSAATPDERSHAEAVFKTLKMEIENEKQQQQSLREREPQLAARLQAEQAKLNELNESLDKLERELENAAGEKGKRP